MNDNSGCLWFFAIVIGIVIIGFAANQDDEISTDEEEEYFSPDSVKTYSSHKTINPNTLSSP